MTSNSAGDNRSNESNVRRLSDAVRRIRVAEAERADAFVDLHEADRARLGLVAEELARGELILLDIEQRPANLPVVVSWRVGVEWVEEIVTLCQQVLAEYAQKVGKNYISLTS